MMVEIVFCKHVHLMDMNVVLGQMVVEDMLLVDRAQQEKHAMQVCVQEAHAMHG